MPKIKMVRIKWHDARLFSGTYSKEATLKHKMALFESLGYFITSDKTTTRLATEINDEGEFRDILLIPTGSIIETVELLPCQTK